jgi:hypothetical protein
LTKSGKQPNGWLPTCPDVRSWAASARVLWRWPASWPGCSPIRTKLWQAHIDVGVAHQEDAPPPEQRKVVYGIAAAHRHARRATTARARHRKTVAGF